VSVAILAGNNKGSLHGFADEDCGGRPVFFGIYCLAIAAAGMIFL